MPVQRWGSKETVAALSVAEPSPAVLHSRIIVGNQEGSEFRLADVDGDEACLVIHVHGMEVKLHAGGHVLTLTRPELGALARSVRIWQGARIALAGKVGSGKRYKWFPVPQLAYAPAGVGTPRLIPFDAPEVDAIHGAFADLRTRASTGPVRGLTVAHVVESGRGEPLALFARQGPRTLVLARRNMFVSNQRITENLCLVEWMALQTCEIGRGGVVVDFAGGAVIAAAWEHGCVSATSRGRSRARRRSSPGP